MISRFHTTTPWFLAYPLVLVVSLTSRWFVCVPQYAQREASVEGDVTKKDVWLARLRQLDRAGKDTRAELRKVSPPPSPCRPLQVQVGV